MKKRLFFLMSAMLVSSMSWGVETALRIGEGRSNRERLQDYRQQLRVLKQQLKEYDVPSLQKALEEAQKHVVPTTRAAGKEEKEEGWQKYAQKLQSQLRTYDQIKNDITKTESAIKDLIAKMEAAGEEIPSETISPATAAGITFAAIIAAITAGTLYRKASKALQQQVKNALQERKKEITDISDAERQLLTAAAVASYLPERLKPVSFRWGASKMPVGQELSDSLWPVAHDLYYKKKPGRKKRDVLKKIYDEGRAQAHAAAEKKKVASESFAE